MRDLECRFRMQNDPMTTYHKRGIRLRNLHAANRRVVVFEDHDDLHHDDEQEKGMPKRREPGLVACGPPHDSSAHPRDPSAHQDKREEAEQGDNPVCCAGQAVSRRGL